MTVAVAVAHFCLSNEYILLHKEANELVCFVFSVSWISSLHFRKPIILYEIKTLWVLLCIYLAVKCVNDIYSHFSRHNQIVFKSKHEGVSKML